MRINKIKNEYMAVQNNHNGLIMARKPPLVMTSLFIRVRYMSKDKHIQQHTRTQKIKTKFKV